MSWKENLPSWVSKAPHIFALLFPFSTCGLNFSDGTYVPCRWPMTWGITTMPFHGWRRLSVSSEALMENGRQRMRQVLRMPWITWPSPISRQGSKQETHSFHHSNHNALYLLYHFFSIFMSLNLFHLSNRTECVRQGIFFFFNFHISHVSKLNLQRIPKLLQSSQRSDQSLSLFLPQYSF